MPSLKAKRDYWQRNRVRILAARKERYDNDPVYRENLLRIKRESLLRCRYGITPSDYDKMLANQDFRCGICHSSETGTKFKVFDVDHNHETKKVRGLLCRACNVMLGQLSRAERYQDAVTSYLR